MNKEEILARSRSEAVDEGLREAESRGRQLGITALALWNWRLLSLTGLTAFRNYVPFADVVDFHGSGGLSKIQIYPKEVVSCDNGFGVCGGGFVFGLPYC